MRMKNKFFNTVLFLLLTQGVFAKNRDSYPNIICSLQILDSANQRAIIHAKCEIVVTYETEKCLPELVEPFPSFTHDLVWYSEAEASGHSLMFCPRKYVMKITHPLYETLVVADSFRTCHYSTMLTVYLIKKKIEKPCSESFKNIEKEICIFSCAERFDGNYKKYLATKEAQCTRFIEFQDCIDEEKLVELIENDNKITAAFAWKAYIFKYPKQALVHLVLI